MIPALWGALLASERERNNYNTWQNVKGIRTQSWWGRSVDRRGPRGGLPPAAWLEAKS